MFTPLTAVNDIENYPSKTTDTSPLVYTTLHSIDRRNIVENTGIVQQSTVLDQHTTSNRQDYSINQSHSDSLNDQEMPNADIAAECAIQLQSASNQGSNIT